jgi:hypothetical protein
MALTAIEAVRLKTSDKSTITREVTEGNGIDQYIKLRQAPVLVSPAIEVRKNGTLQVVGVDYNINLEQGIVTWVAIPAINSSLEFQYYWSIFSDNEVQYFLDEAGGDVTIASAKLLLAWAADAAKLAKRQTLSGGGGLGQVIIDTSVAAKELRATAAELIKTEQDLGESIPAEGLTEIPWTEANYKRQLEEHFIRNS